MVLEDTSKQLRTQIEEAIQALELHKRQPEALYKPLSYMMTMPAKRTRPMLCLLACHAYHDRAADAMQLALSLELFHNFTLIHDDIMDNAPTRRGKSTVHEVYSTNTAILSGDALYAYTQTMLAGIADAAKIPELLSRYSQMALEVCEGQMRDMLMAEDAQAVLEDYLLMIEQKTAALLGASLAMGAYLGGANMDQVKALDAYGRKMGIGFQLLDDLLDVYAEADKFGKQPGGDIIENKKTFLWLTALEVADEAARKELLHWESVRHLNQEKVHAVKAIFDTLDMHERTTARIQQYREEAEALLEPLLPNPVLSEIHAYLSGVLARNH